MRFVRLAAALVLAAAAAVPVALAAGEAGRGAALAESRACGTCHGLAGRSGMPGAPSLAGQPTDFTTLQLILFREGLRDVPPMTQLARGLTDAEIEDLAAHYAALPPGPPPDRGAPDPARLAAGAELAARLNCGVCHRPDYAGQAQVPRIAAQREEYVAATLMEYRDGRRRGTDTNMNAVVYGLTEAELGALAHLLAHR